MDRLKLLVLFGGISEEHGVSVKSAKELAGWLDKERYAPVYVRIGRDGAWRRVAHPAEEDPGEQVLPGVGLPGGGLVRLAAGDEVIPVDAAFPLLHGRGGEDGAIQGLLETMGLPYVGCGVAASALAMDKALTYRAAQAAGVAVPRHRVLAAGEPARLDGLTYPVFVKPARSGSSFGVSRVDGAADLARAVALARRYDGKVLVEEAVQGFEVGCALLGEGDNLAAGEPDRIVLSGGFFRIHQEAAPETGSQNATIEAPAHISAQDRAQVLHTARQVYRALGCEGLARVDMFLDERGRVTLNEVNTMPGMTSYSRYPRMMAAAGWSMGQVAHRLIQMALSRQEKWAGAQNN